MQISTLPFNYLCSGGEIRHRGHLGETLVFLASSSKSLRGLAILKCSPLIHLFSSLCRALYLSMKDTEKGIKELNLEKDKKVFNHCFTGKSSCKSDMGQLGKAIWSSRSAICVGRGVCSRLGRRGHRRMTGEHEN